MTPNRETKDTLFELVARITKAVASPKRLELLELLCQAPKPVEMLARECAMSIKLASAHLKELRIARLVETERNGKQIIYRVATPDVSRFWVALRMLAEDRLFELQEALRRLAESGAEWCVEDREELLSKARTGELTVIDVRPRTEYEQGHLPFARSLPLAELRARLAELPKDKPIIAYCRGPFCLMSEEAVHLLSEQGFAVRKLADGVPEWIAAGLPVEAGAESRHSISHPLF